ncbi:MAG: 5-oxoprolinase subunit PxpA [Lewinella sp.]
MELNADLGESWYDNTVGDDSALMPYLDACNIACGFHGGDALTMQRTIDLALEYGVTIGAHPSFPDREHFGRRHVDLDPDRLYASLLYQVAALKGMVLAAGGRLHHLKAHGALYHFTNRDTLAAECLVSVMTALDVPVLFGPPIGELRKAATAAEVLFYGEGFADRRYESPFLLTPRDQPNACIDDVSGAIEQVRLMREAGLVETPDGKVRLDVDTICIHGDHAGAAVKARAIRELLDTIPPRG